MKSERDWRAVFRYRVNRPAWLWLNRQAAAVFLFKLHSSDCKSAIIPKLNRRFFTDWWAHARLTNHQLVLLQVFGCVFYTPVRALAQPLITRCVCVVSGRRPQHILHHLGIAGVCTVHHWNNWSIDLWWLLLVQLPLFLWKCGTVIFSIVNVTERRDLASKLMTYRSLYLEVSGNYVRGDEIACRACGHTHFTRMIRLLDEYS